MSTVLFDSAAASAPAVAPKTNKIWRELSRPVRQLTRRVHGERPQSMVAAPSSPSTSSTPSTQAPTAPWAPPAAGTVDFDPRIATVEAVAIPFIQRLIRESAQYQGPIIEIGTLLGVTTTHMALAKAAHQRIITVDLYCWNPWGFTPAIHEAHARQILHYLVQTGHVEQITMDKDEFFRTYRGPAPAMVFLDAMHDYENTKKDIEWAQSVGAKIISGHDYCDLHPGVMQIVDELGGPRELGGSVWVL